MESKALDDDGSFEKKRFKGLVYTRKRFKGAAVNKTNEGNVANENLGFHKDVNIEVQESRQDENLDALKGVHGANKAGKDVKIGTEDLGVEADSGALVAHQDANVRSEDCILVQDADTGIQDAQQIDNRGTEDPMPGSGAGSLSLVNRITVNLAGRTKRDNRELKFKLEGELDTVRNLLRRIDGAEEIGGSGALAGEHFNNGSGTRQVPLEAASGGVRRLERPWDKLRVPVMRNSRPVREYVEREKRTPKANQLYNNSEFLLAKDKFPSSEISTKVKSNGQKQGVGGQMGSKFYKSCSSLLQKLMKHKNGWVFNTPVDVVALKLHDYYDFIKQPMDLGTIKTKLHENQYNTPKQFAEDVRLTFSNAKIYNPKGHDVHTWAEQLLKIFEDRWVIIESDYNREMRFAMEYEARLLVPNPQLGTPVRPAPLDMRRVLDRSESVRPFTESMSRPISLTPSVRTPAPKKPKANDLFKRRMTLEEKTKLIENIQNLPQEKMGTVLQIVKKNNAVSQHDEEIELDIDAVDVETLWELDRLVTNYKKNLSKRKRKAELAIESRAEGRQSFQYQYPAPVVATLPREIETDRGETNILYSGAAQADRQGDIGNRPSGSSTSSSSGSSSDSDSGSSSSS